VKILVVEDDIETARYISSGLAELGHNVTLAADGRDGLFQASEHEWDLLLVDRMLPLLDGLAMVKALRAMAIPTPVLFLTTLGGINDRVAGLNAGGDDYLVKPFAFSELAARVAALGRRPRRTQAETLLRVADLQMDLIARTVQRAGQLIDLQPREFRLLEVLLRHAGEVVTRTMLLEKVWDLHFDPQTNVVESHMSRLRAKLDVGAEPLIHTVRGAGYSIREART
jgi:two-component system OmpR family response regulator